MKNNTDHRSKEKGIQRESREKREILRLIEGRMIKLRPDQRSARIASRPIFTAVKIVSSSLEDRRIGGSKDRRIGASKKNLEREREKGKKENPARTTAPTGSERRKTTVRTRRRRREEKRNTTHLDHHRSSTCTRYSPWMAA